MFKRVLLSYDFSKPSEELFLFLDELKDFNTEEVILTHVIDPGMRALKVYEEAEKYFAPKKKELEEKSFNVQVEIPVGFPAQEINRMARKKNISLILIGSKGRSKIKELMLGSVAANIIRISEVPVFIEKYKETKGGYNVVCTKKFCKILYPTDFSDPSQEVYEKLKELIRINPERIEEIFLSHVVDTGVTEEDIEERKEEAMKKLDKMKEELKSLGTKVKIKIMVGVPSENINNLAEDEEVTLVMLASRGAGGIKELLLGSTAENVARRSSRPVMLFPYR